MKKINKIISVLLALALAIIPSLPILPASAEGGASGGGEIVGIDYSRITQKADGGKRNYPVELKLGNLTFSGELIGEIGITMEELNAIINQTLSEKGLTAERVALVRKIAERVQSDAKLYWGDQVAEGLLSYLQIPGTAFSVGDYYDYVVHDDLNPAAFSAKKAAAEDAAKAGLKAAAKAGGRVGRVAKATGNAVGKIPMLGQLVNTALVANSWLDGSKRFDEYLELLEENLAIINDFYAACSRRASDLAESRDEGSTWKIRFDKRKNYRTYNCTFWGIPGNIMSCEISGTLTNSGKGAEGTYSGTLWLEFSAVDFSQVENNTEKTSGLKPVITPIYTTGGYTKTSDTGGKTALRCESQGQLTFYIAGTEGTVKPNVVGSLSNDKEITFSFDRSFEWHNERYAALGSHGITEAVVTGNSIDSVRMKTFSKVYSDNGRVESVESDETYGMDPGDVLAPLDSDPVITIRFS
ncbi:MAG: hypothetical protein IKX86_06680 [Clostridia bacterium]|nr:hypothetical protein [Clostridia bacterium]